MSDHRWSKFWWADYERDAALKMCSLAAQGLWMRLLCFAHEGEPYGHLTISGTAPSIRQIATIVSAPEREVARLIKELEGSRVLSRTADGTIFSRRMVRDRRRSEKAKIDGATGGNPNITPAARQQKPPSGDKAEVNPQGKPPPHPVGLTPGVMHQEAESEAESERKQAAHAPARKLMPRLSDPPEAWACLADDWEVDTRTGIRRPVVAGFYIDVTCRHLCQAAKFTDQGWRGDWGTVAAWLREGREVDAITAAIRGVAARPNYRPPSTLAYFARPVAEYRAQPQW